MRTLHEAALDALRRPGWHGHRRVRRRPPAEDGAGRRAGAPARTPTVRSRGGGAGMTDPGTTQPAVSRGQPARAGRTESIRSVAARALPFPFPSSFPFPLLARGPGGARPAFSPEALRVLRARHGGAPVLVRGLSGAVLVLLDREDLQQFYAEPADVLAPAQPEPGETHRVHHSCATVRSVMAEEARHLTAATTLDLARARHSVARAARQIVLGEAAAAGDEELTGLLRRLRRRGKDRGDPAAACADPAARARARHWLRAVDTIPATLLRTLLLLGAHPAEQDAVAAEAAGGGPPGELPRLRACVRECLRLYPVVPDLVRVTRTETEWQGVRHPAGTSVLLPAHFHQRDPDHVPAAHVFVPGRWKTPGADEDVRMAPFGHGPGRCPGDGLSLLITTALCAEVLRRRRITGTRPVLDPPGPLPVALDPRGIRLTLSRR
ncbi:cytochrome P450 [Streptomyces sp. NPDC006430]|uniref:cytochrome P450 n=1 Tax=Streptomyces sp. NPDC006430 TaxID=3154299 RepID=UPI0033B8BF6F